jgi:hypothetical protein
MIGDYFGRSCSLYLLLNSPMIDKEIGMSVCRIIAGTLAATLILGAWAAADSDLTDGQMSSMWAGYVCNADCNDPTLTGCEEVDTGYHCYVDDPNCLGYVIQGSCAQYEQECLSAGSAPGVNCWDVDGCGYCGSQTYQYAACHWVLAGSEETGWFYACGIVDPDDFNEYNCGGTKKLCYEE